MILKKNPKFVFWGTPEFSVLILNNLEKYGLIPSAIITSPDKPKGRKLLLTPPPVKVWADNKKIPVFQPATLRDFNFDQECDLFIVAAYGKIIPKRILDLPKRGSLNVHPSLLPLFRGPSPMQSALLQGVKETGVSIMLLDEEMDHGPILNAEIIDLNNWFPTYLELEKKCAEIGAKLLSEIIPEWIENKISPVLQEHSKTTYCKKIEKQDGFISPEIILGINDNTEDHLLAERKVRALNPDPGTFTLLNVHNKEMRIKILRSKITDNKFIPERVIPEGKKEMGWNDFLKGNPIDKPQ